MGGNGFPEMRPTVDYNAIIHFAQQALTEKMSDAQEGYPFRRRFMHTLRVVRWTQRLLEAEPDIQVDKDVLFTSAICHDVGYARSSEGHANCSQEMTVQYLRYEYPGALSDEFIRRVQYIIQNHSNKSWLPEGESALAPMELILLMEADLLDECGALAIVWDSMAEGMQEYQSFEKTYMRIKEHGQRFISRQPMATQAATHFWRERQELMQDFIDQLELDLAVNMGQAPDKYERALQAVRKIMSGHDLVPNRAGVVFPFRQRSVHMRRTFWWATRLSLQLKDKEALLFAAIFHDTGYSKTSDGIAHAYDSSAICREYMTAEGYPSDLIDRVAWMIDRHSDKTNLLNTDNPMDFQLLLEADHLDETGAMAIMWDCMAEGANTGSTYEQAYRHLKKYTGKMLEDDPLQTLPARRYWEAKQHLVSRFLEVLGEDLEPPRGVDE